MPQKTGLGRGLEALIPGSQGEMPEGAVTHVAVEQISPNPRQPRVNFHPNELEELSASIREHGVLQPLIVAQEEKPDRYVLIAGERRLQAARQAGLGKVPVIIRKASDQQRLEMAIIENVQREDLSPLEAAEAYRQLAEDFDLAHDDIAARVGKSRATVTNTLRLLKLPEEVKEALTEKRITEGHARALLALSTPQSQAAALQTILTHDLNVRQTEELARKLSGVKPPSISKPSPPPEITELEERLRANLGTKVTLRTGRKGGTLTIYYYSDEELDAILSRLLGN